MEYLVILLDDTAPSYCAYTVPPRERRLISTEDLKAGITFALKENLRVQFVCPDYALPPEYRALMETVEHSRIQTAGKKKKPTPYGVASSSGLLPLTGIPLGIHENQIVHVSGRDPLHIQHRRPSLLSFYVNIV